MRKWNNFKKQKEIDLHFVSKYPFDIITLVFFLKEKKSSVLLIHEDTPKETAIEMAKRANCVGILYGEYGDFTKLEVGNFLLEEPSLLQYSSELRRTETDS